MTDTFEAQLKAFGLPDSSKIAQVVEFGDDEIVTIGDDTSGCPFTVKTLTTKSLDQMKEWIGNSDETVAQEGIELVSASDIKNLHPNAPEDLAAAARQYVYGRSADVAHLKESIEDILGPFELQVLSGGKIIIKAGQTLKYEGTKPKKVLAQELVFEGPGANIESFVNLTMKITSVEVK